MDRVRGWWCEKEGLVPPLLGPALLQLEHLGQLMTGVVARWRRSPVPSLEHRRVRRSAGGPKRAVLA